MIKPNMPNFPGIGSMTDTLDFVKNLWGGMAMPGMSMSGMNMPGMNVPGMVMPSMSVEEIHKKIADLKAVESWLTLNMNMLRSTIQALEVQAATIATLQTMGKTFTATMTASAKEKSKDGGSAGVSASFNSRSESTQSDAGSDTRSSGAPEPTSKDEADAANLTAPLVNATAWWNMLQDQFKQAVSTAMTPESSASTSSARKTRTKAKPAASTGASATTGRRRKTDK